MIQERGKLVIKGEIQSGISKAGKEWQRQTIVVEIPAYQGTFRKVALNVSQREMADVANIPVGTEVSVSYQVKAREWQGKWFNDVELYSIQAGAFAPKQEENELEPRVDDLPFA